MLALTLAATTFNAPVPVVQLPSLNARAASPVASLSSRRAAIGAGAATLAALVAAPANAKTQTSTTLDVGNLGTTVTSTTGVQVTSPYLGAPSDKDFMAGTDDSLARIVAKNKAKQDAEREAMKAKIAKNSVKVERENAGSMLLIGGVGTAGFVFSLPFFYKNLARLFLRWRSVVDSSIDESQYSKESTFPQKGARRGRR